MAISTLAVRMLGEPIRSIDQATIGPAYMGIGTPLVYPSRLLFIQNLTDAQLMFSLDGVNDNFTLPAASNFVFDITTNQQQTMGIYFATGTRIYVKEVGVPSSGSVYVSSFYGSTL